jgi:mannose-1-phosphate guanylyltransferase/mannose-6-phosphate isomerase
MLIPVILSGGAGTRLWPVSRQAYPKPFMTMADGQSLAQKTLLRAAGVADAGEVVTVTGQDHYFINREHYRQVAPDGLNIPFLLEPLARNTAPAIALAAHDIAERHGRDAKLLVLPADHLVGQQAVFAEAVEKAKRLADQGYLVTFGIVPDRPETGFGYMRVGEALSDDGARVDAFVEKPDLTTAEAYLQAGNYRWNAGMFCFQAGALLDALTEVNPELAAAINRVWQTSRGDQNVPLMFDADTLAAVDSISIDYAVMEKAPHVAVVDAPFDWSDIGSWQAMRELADADDDNNRVRGEAVLVDSSDCYVQAGHRVVAAVGLRNTVIIDTEDALLVADADQSQKVKEVVATLKQRQHPTTTFHQTVHRPWGSFTVLQDKEAEHYKVKRLVVRPSHVLSLQRHQHRSEHWTVVSGVARVRNGDDTFDLQTNQSTYIPAQTMHRLENPSEDTDTVLIEVQCGHYLGEDDIERFEDVYGRK